MTTETTKTTARQRAPGKAQAKSQAKEHTKTQEEMRTSEIRYRRLFESARDGILILDADTRKITDVNPFMVELLGYSREEFLGKELWELGLLKDEEASAAAFRELQENGYIRYEDLPLQTNWGKRREVEFVSNVYAENGHQVIQCNIRDITERKRAERAVHESGERCAFLAESMPQKIFTARPDGEVDYLNQQWTEFSGFPLEQIKGWGWTRFIHPNDMGENIRLWRHSVATGEPFEFEHRFRRADGVYRWHLSRAHAMRDADGKVLMWINSSTDIDDGKRAEAVLQVLMAREHEARSAAEAANRTKDDFLATVSHELRTPLTVILGYAYMLRTGVLSAVETSHALEVIERRAKAQAQLIEDILDVSRIIAGKLRLELVPVSLASVIKTTIENMRPESESKTIQIDTHLDATVGPAAGDLNRLEQIVSNLLSNAIKFTPAGGHVEVRLERVDSQARITVSDSGQGISAEFLPDVFEQFRQSDGTSTRAYSGLGLGLSIVRNLVEMHGGTVRAASPGLGQGASFVINLPLMPLSSGTIAPVSAAPRRATGYESPREISGLRILVVDDDPSTLEMLKVVLEPGGARVRTSDSAMAALEAVQEWKPDLLISDMAMPGKDGYWLIQQVRTLELTSGTRLPAIALTAYVRVEDRASVLEAGFDMYVPKPVEPVELLSIIASLVRTEA
jgi:PAS domain S-box-containing protein